jgi:hypothetical protein
VRFELEQIWPRLAPHGAAVVDDVEKNPATEQFLETHPSTRSVILEAADGDALIGCLVKRDVAA